MDGCRIPHRNGRDDTQMKIGEFRNQVRILELYIQRLKLYHRNLGLPSKTHCSSVSYRGAIGVGKYRNFLSIQRLPST